MLSSLYLENTALEGEPFLKRAYSEAIRTLAVIVVVRFDFNRHWQRRGEQAGLRGLGLKGGCL